MKSIRCSLPILLLCASALFAKDATVRAREVVWRDASRTNALFVPESLLAEPIEALPLSESSRAALRHELAVRPKLAQPCRSSIHTDGRYSESTGSLDNWLRQSKSLIVAEVVETVPGWSTWGHFPVTMVWVRITEVVRDDTTAFVKDEIVAFPYERATVSVAGTTLCSSLPDVHATPVAGERWLLDATRFEGDKRLLVTTHAFPLSADGELQSRPHARVGKFAPTRIERVRELAREQREVRR